MSGGDPILFAELNRLTHGWMQRPALVDRPAAERFASLLDDEPMPDILAGRYRITRELGRGGMARVYLARDIKHSRDVAIKVVRQRMVSDVGTNLMWITPEQRVPPYATSRVPGC